MALPSAILNQFDQGSITIKDGTSVTPLDCVVQFDNADFALQGLREGLRNTTPYEGRGQLRSLRKTGRAYPTGSFSCQVTALSHATEETVADMVLGNGAFASRISTTAAIGDVMTFDLVIAIEGTTYGHSADYTITLEDCEFTTDFSLGDPNTLNFSFTCYGLISGALAETPA